MTEIAPAPTAGERLKELLIRRFGWGGCRHQYIVVPARDRLYLRCVKCPHETEGFAVAEAQEKQGR